MEVYGNSWPNSIKIEKLDRFFVFWKNCWFFVKIVIFGQKVPFFGENTHFDLILGVGVKMAYLQNYMNTLFSEAILHAETGSKKKFLISGIFGRLPDKKLTGPYFLPKFKPKTSKIKPMTAKGAQSINNVHEWLNIAKTNIRN